jgi:predicted porin
MQKKLIALAIAGLSSAAFAQSTVTISGLVDLGYNNINNQTAAAGKDTQQTWAGNGSSTSTIVFSGTEALGGGLTAGFLLASDFTAGANQIGGVAAPTAQTPFANQMFNSQNYLELKSATMGSFKMGTINDASLYTSSASQPFGTAIGSGYSGAFARLNGTGVVNVVNTGALTTIAAGASGAGARLVRVGNSAMYETPSFSGFSASLLHVFKNDNDQYATAGQQELGLKYNNGPINVHYAYYKIDAGNNVTAGGIVGTTVKHNMLGGNYTFGPATVYGGWTSSKGNAAAGTTVDARSWNIALKYAMGNWGFMANVLRVDDKMPIVAAVNGDQDRNLTGLGLDYSMSKRTTAYVRYEGGDNDKSSNTGSNTGAFTRWAAGVRHSF